LVPGSAVLISGDPGIGNRRCCFRCVHTLADEHNVLYITGEESTKQIKLRAKRVCVSGENISVYSQTDIEQVLSTIEQSKAHVVIIDSIQTMYSSGLTSVSGRVSQTRECAYRLIRVAKDREVSIFFVGHVNKDGAIAGPKVLEIWLMPYCILKAKGTYRIAFCAL
jgi:DNA repair protein RadA/Sms